jgi:hypothetical protein
MPEQNKQHPYEVWKAAAQKLLSEQASTASSP